MDYINVKNIKAFMCRLELSGPEMQKKRMAGRFKNHWKRKLTDEELKTYEFLTVEKSMKRHEALRMIKREDLIPLGRKKKV